MATTAEAMVEIFLTPISDLSEEPDNARDHPPENLEAIRASLERFGQVEPLLVRDNVVVHGNGRLRVMRELGWNVVQVVRFSGSEEEAKALGLVMNRTAELARWRPEVLGQSLLSLEASFTPATLGFSEKALGDLFPATGAELQLAPRQSAGLGTPIVQYALIFDDEAQQQRFFAFMKGLKDRWPDMATGAARLDRWIAEHG